jgi:hypothetical protein
MSKIWDEREKSLEDEYFRRKERELIEKLHEQRAEEEQRKKEEASVVHCPKCEGSLKEMIHEGVLIDRCNKCSGVWLDAGALKRLTDQEESHGWLSRMWRGLSNK